MFRWLLSVLVVAAGLVVVAPGATADNHEADSAEWARPVPGAVVLPFDAPTSRFGPGHRGVTLAAPPGSSVRAAGDGVVTFAGPVAHRLHVVVRHSNGLRTSYSYVASIAVTVGARVRRGDVIATSSGTSVHFGLRRGDRYLDPMLLFAPHDVSDMIRLVPDGATPTSPLAGSASRPVGVHWPNPPSWVQMQVLVNSGHGRAPIGRVVANAVASAAGVTFDATADLVHLGVAALAVTGTLTARLAHWSVEHVPAAGIVANLMTSGQRFLAWLRNRSQCDDRAPGADGTGGSGHRLLAVAGIDSATQRDGSTFGLDAAALGYREDEVRWFSYAAAGGKYHSADTHQDLMLPARRLADQLRSMQRAEPGREVDLIAHSQGGVVVDVFLQEVYDATDPTFPPIGTVVTLASPHEGAPLATMGEQLAGTRTGTGLLTLAGRSTSGSVGQLSERSETMRHLWDRPLPDGVDFTSVGAARDLVVPADHTDVAGATMITVVLDGFNDHRAIPHDPASLRAVRAALEGRAPPCIGLADGIQGAVAPVFISRFEHTVGTVAETAARTVDAMG